MIIDERKCKDLIIQHVNYNLINIKFKPSDGSYTRMFSIIPTPTGNCQLACAHSIGPSLKSLNKYHMRDLFMNLRKSVDKKILLLDLNRVYVPHLLDCIPEGAVLMNDNYTSTNGHLMTILLIRMSSIRQLQLPKKIK